MTPPSENKPHVHLVTGGTGAGKTSYARSLADSVRGLAFSIDDWMARLFWMDSPQPIQFEWTLERIARCEAQIRGEVAALARIGVESVLDLGFTKSAHRAAFGAFADSIDTPVALHWVDVPANERWRRVQHRNQARSDTYALDVTREMFDFMESEWEAPSQEEMTALNGRVIC